MSEASPRPTRPVLKLLVASASLLVALAGAEIVNRLRLSAQGRPYDAAAVRTELRRVSEREYEAPDQPGAERREEHLRVLHPYTGFDAPNLKQVMWDAIYFGTPRAEETFDILILGGSVAVGFGQHATDALIELLQQDPRLKGRPMRTLRYARAAFKQPQQLNSLTYLMALGFRPDAVINLDGFNEVAVANKNVTVGVHPLQPAVAQWAPHVVGLLENEELMESVVELRLSSTRTDQLVESALGSKLLWSSIAGSWWRDRVRAARRQQDRILEHLTAEMARPDMNPVVIGPRWEGDLDEVMRFCVTNWMEASISIDAICDRRSIYYLHVLQPTLHSGSKVPTPSEIDTGEASEAWMNAVRAGYPMLIEAGSELREQGVDFLDATDVFEDVTETLYVDACHFSPEGQVMLAEWIAAAFLEGYEQE